LTSSITRSDEGTLHGQLYRVLAKRIATGELKVGKRLPTEAELVSEYAVSRTTARRALDELRRASLVERLPGRGTFVAPPKLKTAIPQLHSITREIEQLGYRPGSKVLSLEEGVADENERSHLRLGEGARVLRVRRLRTADEQPFYVADSTLNLVLFPKLQEVDYGRPNLSMFKVFEEVSGRRVHRVAQWLSAVPATAEVAKHMELSRGTPVLQLERILYVGADSPIESVRAFFRGESYKFYTEITAPNDAKT
jgi:GntR family transcriptional regulator